MNDGRKPPAGPKKPYTTPRLTRYGHVKDIVQGGGGRMADGLFGPRTKKCWVAEAIYGSVDPRTFLLREWLSDTYVNRRRGWPAAALYLRIGATVADLIHRGLLPRRVVRPALDRLFAHVLVDRVRHMKRTERARR